MNEHHEFRPAQRPDKRSDRPEGRFEARTDGKPERPRRSLRETVCDIDRDILRMLMRRHNLIKRMYNAKGFLEPAEEKSIRESWEAAVSRVSRDPRLSGRFFTLMQEVEFLPRPGEDGEAQRPAFNLAPADMPVRLSMPAPRSCRLTRAWANEWGRYNIQVNGIGEKKADAFGEQFMAAIEEFESEHARDGA